MLETIATGSVVALFVVAMGINDGATLVAVNASSAHLPVAGSMAILVGSLVTVPVAASAAVATTVARGLVTVSGTGESAAASTWAFTLAVVMALAVAGILAVRGRPTSLTLALVGSIVGSGLGMGLPVDARRVGIVLLLGLAAPLAAGLIGALVRSVMDHVPPTRRSALRWAHTSSFIAQSWAYGANDGQKAFAVVALVLGPPHAVVGVGLGWPILAFVASMFLCGALLGLRGVMTGLGGRLVHGREHLSMGAQISSALAVGTSAALGAPVSMTQSCAAGLVGCAATEGHGRVQWDQGLRILIAWVVTFPVSLFLGAVSGQIVLAVA